MFDFKILRIYNVIRRIIKRGVMFMATSSFDKNVVLDDPKSANIIINALLSDKRRKVDISLSSDENVRKGERLLRQLLSRSKQ
jgi:hypothetical protein